ncbi:conserved hypothetical protein [Marinobacter adhaerens HP15]|uniref:Uncharacterized protein n=1 Tax=Marinobacter adhaerens (strain DSM 23420 / HP15) TaxID=225937 RepID=E4PJB0_MARAH|nr:conserved hypothetical protein [Marinobacter adhaerens HP15]
MGCSVRQSKFLAEDMGSLKVSEGCLEIARPFRNACRFKLRKIGRLQFTVH